jgi:Cu2+-containing amine oxidase
VTNVDLVRDKADDAESEERLAMVTHYRYEGDLAIQTLVNLTEKKVVSLESIPHLPTPLVAQEFSLARELALSRADVKQALEEYRDRLNVEALVVRTASEDDPLFGHRVVRLLFRVGQDYLSTPIVMVDLTEKKVIIQQPPSRTN